eukprot:scaffold147385_cov23-Tisochrysis_lutea.AAC.1
MMFADGDWEKQMSAMEYIDEKGKVKQLQLDDKDFREVRNKRRMARTLCARTCVNHAYLALGIHCQHLYAADRHSSKGQSSPEIERLLMYLNWSLLPVCAGLLL